MNALSNRLRTFGILFYVGGAIAFLICVFIGFAAGHEGLSQFEKDMDMTWHLTPFVWAWWISAVVVLVQSIWLGTISEAIAVLLSKGGN